MHKCFLRGKKDSRKPVKCQTGWYSVHYPLTVLVSALMSKLVFTSALSSSGTGEHGVGLGKRKYLNEELGPGTVELMKKIKRTLDPYNLFNPGKVRSFFARLYDTKACIFEVIP
jgi:FAD linked oxidases, C-terminal domain